jgi:hypothetical protein
MQRERMHCGGSMIDEFHRNRECDLNSLSALFFYNLDESWLGIGKKFTHPS